MNQNQCFFVGRVAGKPQLKAYKKSDGVDGYRCFFRLATTRLMDRGAKREEQRTNFIPIVSWGEQAKRHAQYLDVGTEVCVNGELIVDSQKNADGSYTEFWNVSARDIQYGQRSLKHSSPEQIQTRITGLQDRMITLLASLASTGAETALAADATPDQADLPEAPPAGLATKGANPFTPDGQAPAVDPSA